MRYGFYFLLSCIIFAGSTAFLPTACISKGVERRTFAAPLSASNPFLFRGRSFVYSREKTIRKDATSVVEKSSSESSGEEPSPVVAIINFSAINELVKILFAKYAITFPSPLAGCGALLAAFLLLPSGNQVYDQFAPGAKVLAKWLPVFFVPSLILLPLAEGAGSPVELLKVVGIIVGGLLFSLYSTAFSVLAVRKLTGNSSKEASEQEAKVVVEDIVPAPPPKPFSDSTMFTLRAAACLSAVLTVIARNIGLDIAEDLARVFMISTTLASFTFGACLPKKFTKAVHPLLTCATLTWSAMAILGKLTATSFRSMLKEFALPAGAGPVLVGFLGPSVVSFACQIFDRRKLIKENFFEIVTAILVSSFGGIFGTAVAVRLLCIGKESLRLSLLSRNITSPLAMAIAGILGADLSFAVSIVVVTGLLGANFGASLLDFARIKDAVARGLGIGAAAHGLGTAAFTNEKDAFPFAAIAMALTASACTILVSIPTLKNAILKIALG
mmetsp:Transcript_26226/g.39703  ORF Transcript_26226/g.39703 Transcript_26226/m.39703 type:complete len:500 (-) Transcript_26226:80-1579(-)